MIGWSSVLVATAFVVFMLSSANCFTPKQAPSVVSQNKKEITTKPIGISYETAVDMFALTTFVYALPVGSSYDKTVPREDQVALVDKINAELKNTKQDQENMSEEEYIKYMFDFYNIDFATAEPHVIESVGRLRLGPQGKMKAFICNFETGLQAMITVSPSLKRIQITFRGSDDLSDWGNNLNALKTPSFSDSSIYVHRGFDSVLDADRSRLFAEIDEALAEVKGGEEYEIFVTGHSLGGALTTLFGYELAQRYKNKKVKAISFASPRVGSAKFRESHDALSNLEHYRFSNARDIVTCLGWFDYKHVGKALRLTDKNIEVYENYEYSGFLYSLMINFRVSEHMLPIYWERLKNAKKNFSKPEFAWSPPKFIFAAEAVEA